MKLKLGKKHSPHSLILVHGPKVLSFGPKNNDGIKSSINETICKVGEFDIKPEEIEPSWSLRPQSPIGMDDITLEYLRQAINGIIMVNGGVKLLTKDDFSKLRTVTDLYKIVAKRTS